MQKEKPQKEVIAKALNKQTPKPIEVSSYGTNKYELNVEYNDGFVGSNTFDTIINTGFRVINVDMENRRIVIEPIVS